MKTKLLIISFLLVSICLFAQEKYSTSSKKAIKQFEKALMSYDMRQNHKAIQQLKAAIEIDAGFIEAYLLMADIYNESGEFEKEIQTYYNVLPFNPDYSAKTYLNLALSELMIGHYEDAKSNFETFLDYEATKTKFRKMAKEGIKRCTFAMKLMENPVPFHPLNLGENANTKFDDYMPSLSADEQTLVFSVDLPVDKNIYPSGRNEFGNSTHEDFYISYKKDSVWTPSKNIGKPVNTYGNEGAQTLSANGMYMFFTACQKADSYGGCDIYFAKKTGNRWSEAINIGEPVNSRYWESQPSISSDGRTLYFVSNRPGGKGGMDIWKSYINDHGRFSKPENLGDSINTRGTESGPFIHPDNQTLYFASDAWLGMGGLDLYVSRKGVTNQWKRPDNLGYPINTHKDEEFLIVNAKGNLAYFSSNREGSRGKDIYNFELYDEAQPFQVTYVKGKVFDAVTNEKLKAKFELIDLETSKLVMEAFSHNKTGEFLVCLPVNKNYALNVSKTGYLFYSENFSLKNPENPSETFLMDIPLQPIREGAIVVLKNIFYETDKYDLKPESKAELSKLISFLNKNPKVNIEISGHTDNIGEDDYNIKLSRNRALSVYNYLTENEISNTRLSYEGYGENSPVASNETEKGRAQNRRTEFKIVK